MLIFIFDCKMLLKNSQQNKFMQPLSREKSVPSK
jgi:hypothetical protein